MGGGTLLIPFLTMFTGVEQHLAQAVNLVAFIPMSVFALIIHIKNGLVDFKYLIRISIPAVLSGVLASYLIKSVESETLKRYFGIFLAALGVYQLVVIVVNFVKNKRSLARSLAKGRVETLIETSEENNSEKFG